MNPLPPPNKLLACRRFVVKVLALIPRGRQGEYERRLGLPATTISKWKSVDQVKVPRLDYAWLLADLLGVPLDYLADDRQDRPPGPALTEEERDVLKAARRLGYDEAMNRLLGKSAPAPAPAPAPAIRPIGGHSTTRRPQPAPRDVAGPPSPAAVPKRRRRR
ncbi:unnamed protein product [uncultured bacterium]|nr:unnamed protein product [uncultured bacterium]